MGGRTSTGRAKKCCRTQHHPVIASPMHPDANSIFTDHATAAWLGDMSLAPASRRCDEADYDHSGFEGVLNSFPDHERMLQPLAGESVASDTKAVALLHHLSGRPSAESLLRYAPAEFLLRWSASV